MLKERLKPTLMKTLASAAVILLGILLLTALLSIRSWYKPSIILNRVSPVTVILEKDVLVTDEYATQQKKEEARLNAIENTSNKEILDIDQKAQMQALEKLKLVVRVVRNSILNYEPRLDPINPKVSILTQDYLLDMGKSKYNQLLLSSDFEELLSESNIFENEEEINKRKEMSSELKSLNEVERKYFFESLTEGRLQRKETRKIKETLGKSFFEGIKTLDYESVFRKTYTVQKKLLDLGIVRGMPKRKIIENIKILYPSLLSGELKYIEALIDISTIPNITINWGKIKRLEKEAMESIKPANVTLKAGSLLASKGELVGDKNFHYLKELDLLHAATDWKEIIKNFYLLGFIISIIAIVSFFTSPRKYRINEIIALFFIPVAVSAINAAITIWGVDKLALAPLATISILLTVFYFPIMAGVIVTIITFFLIKTVDMNFWQILPQYLGSIYAIVLVRKSLQREDLANAGTKIAIAQVVTFLLTIILAVEDFEVGTVLTVAAFYAIGAIFSGFISLASLPYLESGLKLLTPFKLAELSNPNQPLLKKLREEAPGTYEHSLNVSRLSEEAGNALGLNTELIRVGLLYHDIGKMHAPDYFIENTLGKPNPHTTLDDPKKSAEIIIAHVPEGIKMAKRYNLPQAVVDFIPMHQGTTVTNYFFYKAKEKFGEKQVKTEDYSYPGPRPNSKETGVAMIADSTEAALRSIKDLVDEDQASAMIYKIMNARLDEGELDYSGLTRQDLDIIAKSFLDAWRSQNHERVKYPDKDSEDKKKAKSS